MADVDVERLLSAWLRSRDEVTDLVDDRVYTELPERKEWPLVRLTLIGGSPPSEHPLWLDAPVIQFDCYGGPKVMARLIASTIRELLDRELAGTHDEGVVTGVRFGELSYVPDTSLNPPQPRYTFDVVTFVHPEPYPLLAS